MSSLPSSTIDRPDFEWGDLCEGSWDYPTGAIVAMPHTADRLHLGVAAARTEIGFDHIAGADDVTGARATWGRRFTKREQWEHQCASRDQDPGDGPPTKWYADEDIPAWAEVAPDAPGAEEIWVVTF